MKPEDPKRRRLAVEEFGPPVDASRVKLDRRFRVAFAVGAIALVAINAAVGLIVLDLQRQMRDVAMGMYDHAFLPAASINHANVEFQHFVDKRAPIKGAAQIQAANQALDAVVDALDVAARDADDSESDGMWRDARASVLAFEGSFEDGGPAIRGRLRETQALLATLADKAVEKGRRARDRIESTSAGSQILIAGSTVGAVLLGVVTLMVLRRSVAVSTISQISHLANYDSLTGLPNRSLFQRRLTAMLEDVRGADGCVALLSLDLDRFKNVNDTLGHHAGDLLLIEVAQRVRAIARAEDTVARLGGDEFVVLLNNVREPTVAANIADRIVASLCAPYEFSGRRILVGVSVGIALAPEHGGSAEELHRNSDLALYLAKAEGKGQYRFFDAKLNDNVQRRRLMELDLREALETGDVDVFYQPVVEVESGKIVACEALARWDRPGHGFILPGEFIPLAEETGLILALGEVVLRKACLAASGWPQDVSVAVNLSVRQFQGGDLVALVAKCLEDSGLPANRLELEVTESILISNKSGALKTLTALRQLGVLISLDDFGTGYSSLSYLSSFPFDRIKIDRSFVANVESRPDAAAIIQAVIAIAGTLGMSTIAEGVETSENLEWLRGNGCDHAQGYLVSKPLPSDEIERLLRPRLAREAAKDLAA
ncbi:MAG TPA: EAL domain-containing protein [Roseiarcus sp.]|nr:EAL domain-containing protein [Roseiarcus sp.]